MVYTQARQSCYGISLLQFLKAYCTFPSIFTQHILCEENNEFSTRKLAIKLGKKKTHQIMTSTCTTIQNPAPVLEVLFTLSDAHQICFWTVPCIPIALRHKSKPRHSSQLTQGSDAKRSTTQSFVICS